MFYAPLGLLYCPALNAQHNITRCALAYFNHALPIDDAVAAGAAGGRARHLAAFILRLLDRDVLGVDVNEPVPDAL